MKKIYVLRKLFLMLFVTFFAQAALADSMLVVEMKNGTTHCFVLEEQPKVTFHGTELHITSPYAEATLSIADVEKFSFELNTSNGISAPKTADSTFRYVNGIVTVDGAEGTVSVADASGRIVYSAEGASVTVDMNAHPSGIYVVNIGKRSIKIKK